jgi:hypothetical protein
LIVQLRALPFDVVQSIDHLNLLLLKCFTLGGHNWLLGLSIDDVIRNDLRELATDLELRNLWLSE